MTDIIEYGLKNLYPFVTSIVAGAGGYWLTTQMVQAPNHEVAMGVALIVGITNLAGVKNE